MPRGVAPGEATYQPEVMPEDFPRKLTPHAIGLPIAGEAEQFTGALANKFAADSAAWAGSKLSDFRVQAISDLEKQKSATSGDPTGFTEKYLAGFDKQAAEAAETAGGNPYSHSMFEKGITSLRATLAEHSMQWEANQTTAYRSDAVKTNLTNQLPLIEAHPEIAGQVGSTLMDQINTLGGDPSTRLALARAMHEQVSLAAANGLARQNPTGVLHGLDNPEAAPDALRGLTDAQREAVRGRAQAEFVKNRAEAIQSVYATSTTAGVKALAAIDKDDSIPADLKDPIRDQVNRQIDQLRSQRREQFAPQIAALQAHIEGDQVTAADHASALNLYERGAMNPTEFASAMGGIARAEHKGLGDQASLEAVTQAYDAASPLDPQDAHLKKGAQLLFTNLTKDVDPGSPEYSNRAVDVTSRIGIVPEPAISWARSNLIGGDPQSAAAAANLIDRLDGANPRAVPFALDAKTKAIAGVINSAVNAGTDPAAAVTLARRNAEMNEAETKLLDTRWKAAKLDASQANALHTRLTSALAPGLFNSLPKVPAPLQSEFDTLTRDYYRYTGGDISQARDLASRDIRHVWGVSQVNGQRELMAYAPEAMFPGLTPEVVRNDIAEAAKDSKLKDIDPKSIRLVEDPQRTARTQGSQWNLQAPDKSGLMHVLTDEDGDPLVYQLPVTKEDYGAVRDRLAKVALDKARQTQKDRELMQEIRDVEARHDITMQ